MAAAPERHSIYIVDDHPLIRRGVRELFSSEKNLQVVGEADSVEAAIKGVRTCAPDLVIVDISLPDGTGFDLIPRLLGHRPELAILVSSMHEEHFFAERALEAGARGFVSKLEAPEQLIEAVQTILSGRVYLSPELTDSLLKRNFFGGDDAADLPSQVSSLSNREMSVFEQIGAGYSTSQIADKLKLSVKTIETHRLHIKEKLGVAHSAELTRLALHWSLRALQKHNSGAS